MRCAQCDNSMSRRARFCLACGAPALTPPNAEVAAPASGGTSETGDDGRAGQTLQDSSTAAPRMGTRDRWISRTLGLIGSGLFLGVIFLFTRSLSGPDGASSPERAVQDLADAISAEDLAGTLAVIAPDEASGVLQTLTSATPEVGTQSDISTSLAELSELDLQIDDLSMRSRVLGPGLVQVEIHRGTFAWNVPGSQSTLTGAASALGIPGSGRADITEVNPLLGLRPSSAHPGAVLYVLVREGARGWFLSPLYTAAEYATQYLDLPGGNFAQGAGNGPTSGALTPEAAFADLIQAAQGGVPGLLNHVAQTSLPVLRAYEAAAGMLVSEFRVADVSVVIETTTTTRLLDDGAHAMLTLGPTSVGITDQAGGNGEYFEFNGTCVLSCLFGNGPTDLASLVGIDSAYVIAERGPTGWVISPLATAAAYLAQAIQTVQVNPIAAELGLWQLVIPDGAVAVGATTDVLVNDYGFAVYSVQLEAGQSITVAAREEFGEQAYAYLVDPVGGDLLGPNEFTRAGEFARAGAAATYKIVIGVDRPGQARLQLTVSDIPFQQVSLGSAQLLELGPGRECADIAISPVGHPYLMVSTESDENTVDINVAGVDAVGYEAGSRVLRNDDDSEFTVRVCLDDEIDSVSIELTVVPYELGIVSDSLDGGMGPVRGSIGPDGSSHSVELWAFTVGTDLTVTPISSDTDLVVTVYDDSGYEVAYEDAGFGGDAESIYLYDPGTYTIVVTDFSGEVGAGYQISFDA